MEDTNTNVDTTVKQDANTIQASQITPTSTQSNIANFNAKPGTAQTNKSIPKPKLSVKEQEKFNLIENEQSQDNMDTFKSRANKLANDMNVTRGLGVAFFVLIALIWLLIPTASGYTRAQLLWFTLLGETKLTTDKEPDLRSIDGVPLPGFASTDQQPANTTDNNPQPTPTPIVPFTNNTGGGPSIDLSSLDFM